MKQKLMSAAILAAVALLSSSCVTQKKYNELRDDYDLLTSQFNDAKIALASCETGSKSLEERLAEARANNARLLEQLNALQQSLDKSINQSGTNISKLVDEINASNKYIKQLTDAKSKSDSLNIVLTNNLTRSLSKEELKDVDVQVLKGVVYRTGSYEISDKAGQTLAKIAKIITDYKDYEVLIEGNTDNVPISRENIRNNWDLSCLRASSVVQALQNKYGVNPSRLTAAGRGEHNPLESNDTETGRARNRRTQIIITPKLDQFLELIDEAPETK